VFLLPIPAPQPPNSRLVRSSQGERTSTIFPLAYPSMDTVHMLIGDGLVTNLSPGEIGNHGSRSVTPGM
jgi:hypothetical protein